MIGIKFNLAATSVVCCALAALLFAQSRTLRKLELDNHALHRDLEDLPRLTRENEVLSNRLAQVSGSPVVTPDPSTEVLKLRGQIGLLRREIDELRHQSSSIGAASDDKARQTSLTPLETRFAEEQSKLAVARQKMDELKTGLDVPEQIINQEPGSDLKGADLSPYRAFFEARREYFEIEKFSQVLAIKLMAERTDAMLPRSGQAPH
jgi:hypothetical protein